MNDFLRRANGAGQANGDHASSRTKPDDGEQPDRYLRIRRPYPLRGDQAMSRDSQEARAAIWEMALVKTLVRQGVSSHNWAVYGRSAVAVLAILLVSTVVACTSGAISSQPGKRATATATSAASRHGQALGASGCHPASPATVLNPLLWQIEGTGHGGSLWGLLMSTHPLPARVGDQEKIVWRMTGTGPLTLEAIGPGGIHHRLAWGPDAHLGSSWDKPGAEWGAGYVFTAPGCWDLRAIRGHSTADVWLRVVSR